MNTTKDINISDLVFRRAAMSPDLAAVLHPQKITYKELCDRINNYAFFFQKSGIKTGDRSVVLIKPGADMVATVLALVRIGAVPVLIDPGMGIGTMVRALSEISPKVLIGTASALWIRYIWANRMSSVLTWISVDQLRSLKIKGAGSYPVYRASPFKEAAVFYTSGSTGPAKAVEYTHAMIKAQLKLLKDHFGYQTGETDLCTYPLIGFFSICLGLSVVFADFDFRHPLSLNPGTLLDNMKKFNCTLMFCSPLIIRKLRDFVQMSDKNMPVLNHLITAGAPVSYELLKEFNSHLSSRTHWHLPFGATEALPLSDINGRDILQMDEARDSANGICIGHPLKGIDIQVIAIDDSPVKTWSEVQPLAAGSIGEIVVSGDNVSGCYVNSTRANAYAKIKDDEGQIWHRMGDLGKIDRKGRIWFYGRKSQRIELAGKTLYTVPTEAVFNQHKDVKRSALIGKKEQGKIVPVIAVQLEEGQKKNKNLLAELREMAAVNENTRDITRFYFLKKFPVDPRHNAKIFREKIAEWIR